MPTFFITFPRPKNTVVKEPLGKKFDECKSHDPYGGLDIFGGFFTVKPFKSFFYLISFKIMYLTALLHIKHDYKLQDTRLILSPPPSSLSFFQG